MQLKHLESFLMVAKTLSFRRAAHSAGVTQPALSQHVAALERDLGVKVFERNRREVHLTPAGVALRDGATEGLATIERAAELAR
jgi:DNA-binding transcriptional LysR family regulator